jgi:hypothetical protein
VGSWQEKEGLEFSQRPHVTRQGIWAFEIPVNAIRNKVPSVPKEVVVPVSSS